MIYYLAHSEWILFNSRKEIASHLKRQNFIVNAITTEEKYKEDLKKSFNDFFKWKVDRNKLIDLKGVLNLRKIFLMAIYCIFIHLNQDYIIYLHHIL